MTIRRRRLAALVSVVAAVASLGIACEPEPDPAPAPGGSTTTTPSAGAGAVAEPGWRLGVFRGSMHPDYVAAHERWLGRRVDVVLEMLPQESWEAIDAPVAQLEAWKGTPYEVVFTTPMIPRDGSSLARCGAGAYDEHWRRFAATFVYAQRPAALIRLGHEFNHTFYPWTASGGREQDYAECFRRVVDVTRSVPGSKLRFVWNVLSGVETANVEAAYPGDAHVDVIGLDLYDGVQDVPDFHDRWKIVTTQPYGLDWVKRFAAQHGKPISFDEWALVKSTNPDARDPSGDSGDNTVFINGMLDFFAAENVLYACYFDWRTRHGWTDSRIFDGPYPNASAAYHRRVSQPGTSPTSAPAAAPAPDARDDIVLIVGDANTLPSKDFPLRDRLLGLGRDVRLVDDDRLAAATIDGAPLVVVSSSVVPDKIPTWLATITSPLLNTETYAHETLRLGRDGHERAGTSVEITDGGHAVAGGRRGTVTVQSSAPLGSATAAPGATVLARVPGGGDAAVWAIDTGGALTSGTAPARRVALFLSYDSPPALTADGWAMVDAAARWLLG